MKAQASHADEALHRRMLADNLEALKRQTKTSIARGADVANVVGAVIVFSFVRRPS